MSRRVHAVWLFVAFAAGTGAGTLMERDRQEREPPPLSAAEWDDPEPSAWERACEAIFGIVRGLDREDRFLEEAERDALKSRE